MARKWKLAVARFKGSVRPWLLLRYLQMQAPKDSGSAYQTTAPTHLDALTDQPCIVPAAGNQTVLQGRTAQHHHSLKAARAHWQHAILQAAVSPATVQAAVSPAI